MTEQENDELYKELINERMYDRDVVATLCDVIFLTEWSMPKAKCFIRSLLDGIALRNAFDHNKGIKRSFNPKLSPQTAVMYDNHIKTSASILRTLKEQR